jgi:hypothetical protein
MAPSLQGLAPFQIGFAVRDVERAAGELDARLGAGPWRGWLFGARGRAANTGDAQRSGHSGWR